MTLAGALAQDRVADGDDLADAHRLAHRDPHAALRGDLDRPVVARVDVADHAHAGVVGQHALELLRREVGAVGDADHARRGSSGRCRRRRRGGCSPTTRRTTVLTSAFSSGQSAIASEPSAIASVSRYGEATEPESRWSRPMTIGALSSPRAHHLVEAQPEPVALAVAEPADPRRQALERDPLAAPARSSGAAGRRRGTPRARRGRWRRCRPGRPTARPSGTGPCPRRTAAARTRARSRGRRTRARSRRAAPPRAGCCRSRRPRRRASRKPTIAAQCAAIDGA